jgi:hypothetical protein
MHEAKSPLCERLTKKKKKVFLYTDLQYAFFFLFCFFLKSHPFFMLLSVVEFLLKQKLVLGNAFLLFCRRLAKKDGYSVRLA